MTGPDPWEGRQAAKQDPLPPPDVERAPISKPFDGFAFPAVVLVFAAACVLLWLAMLPSGGSENIALLVAFGAKVNTLIAEGEYWRLLSAAFLHGGFMHLALNM